MSREERVDDLLVLLRLARAGRVDEPAAGPDDARPLRAACAAAPRRAPAGRPRSGASGCPDRAGSCRAPSRARRAARVEDARERQRPRASAWTMRTRLRARRPHGPRQQLDPPAADVGGDDQARVAHRRRHRRRLAAGRRAGVEDALAGRGADESRHQLRRLVLDDEQRRCSPAASAADCPSRRSDASGAKRAGSTRTPCARSASASASRVVRSGLARSVSGAGSLLNRTQRLGRLEAVAIEPARRQPARMRQRDRQVVERGVAIAADRRARWQRQLVALAADAAQHALTSRAALACRPCASARPRRRRRPTRARDRDAAAGRCARRRMSRTSGSSRATGAPAERGDDVIERAPASAACRWRSRRRARGRARRAAASRARASACGRSARPVDDRAQDARTPRRAPARSSALDRVPGVDAAAGEELARGHRPPAFGLELEDAQHAAVAGDDHEPSPARRATIVPGASGARLRRSSARCDECSTRVAADAAPRRAATAAGRGPGCGCAGRQRSSRSAPSALVIFGGVGDAARRPAASRSRAPAASVVDDLEQQRRRRARRGRARPRRSSRRRRSARRAIANIGPASSSCTTRMIVTPVSRRRRSPRDGSARRRASAAAATRAR